MIAPPRLVRSAAACVAAMFVSTAVACSTIAQPNGAARGPQRSVRFSIATDPRTLDPLFAGIEASGVDAQLARLLFEPFVDFDARGNAIPALLERVPTVANGGISADGKTLTYVLRRDARWEDGTRVTARDVLFTLRAILDPKNPVRSRAAYERIERATALDDRTVRFRLRAAWAPAALTFFSYSSPAAQYVLPEHLLAREHDLATARFGSAPIGDGPYRLVSWRRGDGLTLAANPRYWGGTPKTERLDIRVVADPGTNLTLLRSGELDWNLIAPSQQSVVDGRTDLRFHRVPVALAVGLAINTRRAPLDDVRVRRALAASIDRAAISRKITLGLYPPLDTAQPLGSWARDPAVRLPTYDPAAADALFDAAGWRRGASGVRERNGKRFELTYVQFPESSTGVRVANFIQAELAARGVTASIKSVANAKLFLPASEGGVLASGRFDLAYIPWPMSADPDDSALFACDGIANYARWCDPTVTALERTALRAATRAERATAYHAIERRVAAEVPIVFLFGPRYTYAVRNTLHGFAPNAFLPTWNAASWQI